MEFDVMYHVVICTKDYQAPLETRDPVIFKKGDVYQAENHDGEYRVWRSNISFLKFSPFRFHQFFRIFC
jgi:hypothetical protein